MLSVDRKDFCPISPYFDSPQRIGYEATISAPHMHAYALELMKDHLKPGSRGLDIGSGSGYLAVCMALMVGDSGKIVGVEHIPQLCDLSIQNIKKSYSHLLENGQLKIITGDGRHGYHDDAPFDCIHVGAAAPQLPQELIDQLAPGGRLIIPVGTYSQQLMVVDKSKDGRTITKKPELDVMYVPLTSAHHQLGQYEQKSTVFPFA